MSIVVRGNTKEFHVLIRLNYSHSHNHDARTKITVYKK